jgi:hypothetical protein
MENRGHAIAAKGRATEELNRGLLTKTQWKRITSKANLLLKRYGKKGVRGLGGGIPGLIELKPKSFRRAKLTDATEMLRGAMAHLAEGDAEMSAELCLAGAIEATMAFKEDHHLANRIINTARGILRMSIRYLKYDERIEINLDKNNPVLVELTGGLGRTKRKRVKKKRKVSQKTLAILKKGRAKRLANLRKKKTVKRTVKRTGRKTKKRTTRKRRK